LTVDRPLPPEVPRLSRLSDDELHAEILRRIRGYDVDSDAHEIIERALAYPFDPPPDSYVLEGREPRPVRDGDLRDDLHPVLAYGSNSSTRALLRKFGGDLHLPVLKGELEDFEVVYSSHLSAYGSVPVTLHQAPGARIQTFVTLVTDDQLVRLAETEFNYAIHRLEGMRFSSPEIDVESPISFVSRHGALGIEGEPVRLVDREQADMIDRVRAHLAPDEDLHDFIVRNVRDPDRAVAFTAKLKERKLPFAHPQTTVLDV
jgi:hypothetical protein